MALGPLTLRHRKTPGARALGVFLYRALSGVLYRALSGGIYKGLGVFVCGLLAFGALPGMACPLSEALERESVRVVSVHDGDSVRLADGRRVRLIGINAPELAREGRPAEPLAAAAGQALREQVANESALLFYDRERKDHYGRTLGHLFTTEGQSLEALLLRQGLAFHIAIPPNLTLASCLSEAEKEARVASRGIWASTHWPARSARFLTSEHVGFQRVRGTIKDISRGGGSVWLELDGPVVLQMSETVWTALDGLAAGQQIEARGWLIDRAESRAARRGFKPLVLRVSSGYAIDRLKQGD